MKTNRRSAVSNTALTCLAIMLTFLVASCDSDAVTPSPSTTTLQPSPNMSSVDSVTLPTRAAIQGLILEYATFEKVEELYELEIDDVGLVGSFSAHSLAMPDLNWSFISTDDEPDEFYLDGVWGPASFILPEYVGMQLDEIPIVLMIYGEDEGGTSADMLDDDGWDYRTMLLSTPGTLSANDDVSMSASMDRQ